MKIEEIAPSVTTIPEVVNPELPCPDGTVLRIGYTETINIGNFQNIKPTIEVEIPIQRTLIKKAINSVWPLVKSEFDKIVKEVLAEKGL